MAGGGYSLEYIVDRVVLICDNNCYVDSCVYYVI